MRVTVITRPYETTKGKLMAVRIALDSRWLFHTRQLCLLRPASVSGSATSSASRYNKVLINGSANSFMTPAVQRLFYMCLCVYVLARRLHLLILHPNVFCCPPNSLL